MFCREYIHMDKITDNSTKDKYRAYDFVLTVATVFILSLIGAIFTYGTIISFINSLADPQWTSTTIYSSYLIRMNSLALPLFLLLLIVFGLCIPKRLISKKLLIIISILLIVVAIFVGILVEPIIGFSVFLFSSILIQLYVIYAIVLNSKSLLFLREGKIVRLGSGLLHLGFLILLYDIVFLQKNSFHIRIFWVSTILIISGNIMSFYPNLFKREKQM